MLSFSALSFFPIARTIKIHSKTYMHMIVCCQQILENFVIWCEWIWVFFSPPDAIRNGWHVNSNKSDTYTAVAISSYRSYFLSLGNNNRQFCHDILLPSVCLIFFVFQFLRVCFYSLYIDVKPKNTPLDVTMTMAKTNMTRNRRAKNILFFFTKLTSTVPKKKNAFAEFFRYAIISNVLRRDEQSKMQIQKKRVLIAVQNDCVLHFWRQIRHSNKSGEHIMRDLKCINSRKVKNLLFCRHRK